MGDKTKEMMPPVQDAPGADPPAAAGAGTTQVIWVHDGPVCVSVVDLPAPHVSSGICRCPACLAHDPDRAVRFL
jgi:hypothetical protein